MNIYIITSISYYLITYKKIPFSADLQNGKKQKVTSDE